MPNTRVSDLSAANPLASTDLFYVVQTPGAGGVKLDGAQLREYIEDSVAGLIVGGDNISVAYNDATPSLTVSFVGTPPLALLASNNLSDVADVSTSRTNLTLGTANDVQFGSIGAGTAPVAGQGFTVRGTNTSDPTLGDFQIFKENYWSFNFVDVFSDTTSHNINFFFRRARGSRASPAAVQLGDPIGAFGFQGYSPAGGYVQTVAISAAIDTAPSGSSVPMSLLFRVGSTAAVERMRITSTGNVGIAKTAPTTPLDVNGAVRVGQFTVASVPSASTSGAGAIIYVSNESGGAVIAFSDGTNWRRSTDRAIIS